MSVLLLAAGIKPAQAQSTHHFETCRASHYTERYIPGRYGSSGEYIRGDIRVSSNEIPCYTTSRHYSYHNHTPTYHPALIPQQQLPSQQQNIQQVSNTPTNSRSCDKISRVEY